MNEIKIQKARGGNSGKPRAPSKSKGQGSRSGHGSGYGYGQPPRKSMRVSPDSVEAKPLDLYRVVLIGKPNVGKSSLFNALTQTTSAIITHQSGTTRDSINRVLRQGEEAVMLSDLPGWDEKREEHLKSSDPKAVRRVRDRTLINPVVFSALGQEVEKSDILVMVMDIDDITAEDRVVLDWIQKYDATRVKGGKPILYCANKCDHEATELNIGEVYELGIQDVIPVSSKLKRGLDSLIRVIFTKRQELVAAGISSRNPYSFYPTCDYKLAIVGKPNAGKSSLMNALLHKERAVVSEAAGTTRDLVEDYLVLGKHIVKVIDTGGLRRKAREKTLTESHSVEKAVHAINQSQVVILMVDAIEGFSDQDKKIAALALKKKKSLVVALNKWDLVDESWDEYYQDLSLTYPPITEFPIVPVSCVNRKNLMKLLKTADGLYRDRSLRIDNEDLTQSLKGAADMRSLAGGGGVKIRYAMQVQNHPPVFYIYVNGLNRLKGHFRKYLYNHLEKLYRLKGTPLTLRFFEHRKAKPH